MKTGKQGLTRPSFITAHVASAMKVKGWLGDTTQVMLSGMAHFRALMKQEGIPKR